MNERYCRKGIEPIVQPEWDGFEISVNAMGVDIDQNTFGEPIPSKVTRKNGNINIAIDAGRSSGPRAEQNHAIHADAFGSESVTKLNR
jgi:hypothetical protein